MHLKTMLHHVYRPMSALSLRWPDDAIDDRMDMMERGEREECCRLPTSAGGGLQASFARVVATLLRLAARAKEHPHQS
jgi:hypothetical protein